MKTDPPPNMRAVFRPLLDLLFLEETELWEYERAGRTFGIFETGRTGPGGGTTATPESVTVMTPLVRISTTYHASPKVL